MHDGHVMNGVERRHIGVAGQRADLALDLEFADAFDQLFARLPVRDQIGDGNLREFVPLCEICHPRPAHHRAVVVHQFRQHADRRQASKTTKIDAGLGMSGAHQHAAVLGDQGKDVTGPDEIRSAAVAIGQRPNRVGSLLRRNSSGQTVAHVHRDRESGPKRGVIGGYHRVETKPARLVAGQRRTDDPRRVAYDERHFLGRAKRGGHEQIALVLAIVVIGDDNDLAAGKGRNRRFDALVGLDH
jgi:hypothetical protein